MGQERLRKKIKASAPIREVEAVDREEAVMDEDLIGTAGTGMVVTKGAATEAATGAAVEVVEDRFAFNGGITKAADLETTANFLMKTRFSPVLGFCLFHFSLSHQIFCAIIYTVHPNL